MPGTGIRQLLCCPEIKFGQNSLNIGGEENSISAIALFSRVYRIVTADYLGGVPSSSIGYSTGGGDVCVQTVKYSSVNSTRRKQNSTLAGWGINKCRSDVLHPFGAHIGFVMMMMMTVGNESSSQETHLLLSFNR